MINLFTNTNKLTRFVLLYWVAVFAGIFLWSRDWEIVRLASTKQKEDLFGLFSFCMFFSMILIMYIDFRTQTVRSSKSMVLVGIPFLISLFFLVVTMELSRESWDYQQYEAAFRAIVDGKNPYLGNRYLYPPFFAEVMVLVFRIGLRVFSFLGLGKSSWVFVFYIHQSLLLFFYYFLICYPYNLRQKLE
ncbi:MAG: hypothetical protein HC797_05315 [Anaerolineales bacterium]|nr:hypothetical protein [Anaerolineales bacterium]